MKNKTGLITYFLIVLACLVQFQAQAKQKPYHAKTVREMFVSYYNRDYDRVMELSEKYPGIINEADELGRTVLHWAAINRQRSLCTVLVKGGADCNVKDKWNKRPVDYTSRHPCEGIPALWGHTTRKPRKIDYFKLAKDAPLKRLKKYVEKSPKIIKQKDKLGLTLLHYSAENCDIGAVKYLVGKGAPVNAKSCGGFTALHVASGARMSDVIPIASSESKKGEPVLQVYQVKDVKKSGKRLEIIRYLLKHGANVNYADDQGKTPMHWAVRKNLVNTIAILADNGADLSWRDKAKQTPINEAVFLGKIKPIKVILKKAPNEQIRRKIATTGLSSAVYYNKEKIVELMIKNGAQVNRIGPLKQYPLEIAYEGGKNRMINLLVRHGALSKGKAWNWGQWRKLLGMVRKGELAKASGMLRERPSLAKLEDFEGRSLLLWSVRWGSCDLAEQAIKCGAPVNSRINNLNYKTPIFYAVENKDVKMTKLLIKHGAKLKSGPFEENTLLHAAVRGGKKELVRILIAGKVDLNRIDSRGRTPLHIAVEKDHQEVVVLLIKAGAMPGKSSESLGTPLDLAKKLNRVEIARYLAAHGAK